MNPGFESRPASSIAWLLARQGTVFRQVLLFARSSHGTQGLRLARRHADLGDLEPADAHQAGCPRRGLRRSLDRALAEAKCTRAMAKPCVRGVRDGPKWRGERDDAGQVPSLGIVTEAIFGLVGVVIGGLLNGGVRGLGLGETPSGKRVSAPD